MASWVEHAVDSLEAAIVAGLPAQLTAVETAAGLDVGALPAPGLSVKARVPYESNKAVTLMTFDLQWAFVAQAGQRNRLMAVECMVAITRHGNSSFEENETRARQYQTALIETLLANPTLSSQVVSAIITTGDAGVETNNKRMTQTVSTLTVEVTVRS
jgi:hypothetical protein